MNFSVYSAIAGPRPPRLVKKAVGPVDLADPSGRLVIERGILARSSYPLGAIAPARGETVCIRAFLAGGDTGMAAALRASTPVITVVAVREDDTATDTKDIMVTRPTPRRTKVGMEEASA
jgi:hypothetical protein